MAGSTVEIAAASVCFKFLAMFWIKEQRNVEIK